MSPRRFFVGTFNTPQVYTLSFDPDTSELTILNVSKGPGSHSWLAFPPSKKQLYATSWTEPATICAYTVKEEGNGDLSVEEINSVKIASGARSGYVCASETTVYSAGGPAGDVFEIDQRTGGLKPTLQALSFIEVEQKGDGKGGVMDFGGLRHGAHSVDLSADGKACYIADIGRNCVWCYHVIGDGSLELGTKHICPRAKDGPRHTWPHPNGRVLYVLEEHTSIVDIFEIAPDRVTLMYKAALRILPPGKEDDDFWADEVRLSPRTKTPKYLYASNRGLKNGEKGFVYVFGLDDDGLLDETKKQPLAEWQTSTSGGWANAIEPGFIRDGVEYSALTDSEEGLVMVLAWDGTTIKEVARTKLDEGAGAATAVWYD